MFKGYFQALHEAAHAVAIIRCGFPLEYVTLDATSSHSLPHAKHGEPYSEDEVLTTEGVFDLNLKTGIVYLAGHMAVQKADPKRNKVSTRPGDDFANSREQADLLSRQSGRSPQECWQLIRSTTQELVDREWTHIQEVAAELRQQRRLTGERVRQIVGPVRGGNLRFATGAEPRTK